MRILPSAPSSSLTFTEQKVFGLVQETVWGRSATALSSVNLSNHEYKRWGELDFVIIHEGGLVAIEVKGGDVSCNSGIWKYTTRQGVVSRTESPYAQVATSFFSLEEHVARELAKCGITRPIPGGFCVIFAGMRRTDLAGLVGGPDAPAELTGSAEDLADAAAIGRFLDRVVRYWDARGNARAWSAAQARAVTQHLRPDFDRAVPLALRIQQVRDERVRFTDEQYELLDFLEGNPRLLITGAAGCGKTFLGLEVARREATVGNRVLLLTGTPSLAQHIQKAGALPEQVAVRTVADALERPPETHSADLVIVDEGQQVTTPKMWALLDHVLIGGAEGGRWIWLADYARQIALDSFVDDATLSLLRMASTHQQLIHNCRNTPQLVTAAESISGVKIGRALVRGAGPNLSWATGRSRAELPKKGGRQLKGWLDSEVTASDITLLAASAEGEREAAEAAATAGVRAVPWAELLRSRHRQPAVAVSSIIGFRGLESEYVQIYGLDDVATDDELRALCYLAITRANFAASICATQPLERRLASFAIPAVQGANPRH